MPGESHPTPPSEVTEAILPEPISAEKDSARSFHEVTSEWLELSREYQGLAGSPWHVEKRRTGKVPTSSFVDRLKAIEQGKSADIIGAIESVKGESGEGKDQDRLRLLSERLTALDGQIARLKILGEARAGVRVKFQESRRFEETLRTVQTELQSIERFHDELDRREFDLVKTKRGNLSTSDRAALSESAALKDALATRVQVLETEPETAQATHAHELLRYRDGLAGKEHFAETPSRKNYLAMIRRLWEEGKNVFLSGPTGGGKTELFIYLGKKLYGEPPEIVRGSERTGPDAIFGKMGLRQKGKATKTFFQPGRYVHAIDKGKPLIFDEFNLLDPKVRLQLKELYNRKPGDTVVMQEDTGAGHEIQKGFCFGATANIKSDKHKERFELDPAESRVFDMRRIEYVPKEELYDLSLGKLMDARGQIRLASEDAHGTLKRFAESAEMIQGAFLGTQTALYEDGGGTKKKLATLEKAVLDPGRVLSMLEGWPVADAKGQSFPEYLNDQLRDFLNQEDFPEKDRKLILKILVTKGFFKGRRADEFQIAGVKQNDLQTWGWTSVKDAHAVATLSLQEVARLDPFEVRKGKIAAIGAEFLAGADTTKPPRTEGDGVQEFVFNETEARNLGLERLEVKGNQEAQTLMRQVMDGVIDITTDDGKKQFAETWAAKCPNIPAPCVPDKGYWWYLTQLTNKKIVSNLEEPPQPVSPHFDADEVLLVDSWQETNWDAPDAKDKHKSPLLNALMSHESTVNIKRDDIDAALWQGDPTKRIPTSKHIEILNNLGIDSTQFELRLIRQDEYARLSPQQRWGQKNLWTNFDHYGLEDFGVRHGLAGGLAGNGGASYVDSHSRGLASGSLTVRLVLARKL